MSDSSVQAPYPARGPAPPAWARDDSAGTDFLQWCLPRLRLRWRGSRKVRRKRLASGGALVIGSSESLPGAVPELEVWCPKCRIYRRR